jgi:valyl-tRNA synthetase
MIDKTYQPSEVEGRIYETWERAGAFRAGKRPAAEPYSIVIPPPNVTGSLHMGHALNNTLQDILCRFERMRGKDVLWQPGTDHAGIATQMVVERQLAERGERSRREMGREAFLKRVWEWKAESGGTIVNQLKRLGASCDWSRERFTMDEGLSRAVLKVFVELYNTKLPDGTRLIYKDKRLVNWDPKLLTAISDLEVVQVETKGHLWHLRYPIEGKKFDPADPSTYIVVATTRPETMLGDTAVAVHPDDERYKALVGKKVILPLVGRKIPIIADEYSDPEKGSGAVKITPAHDFNDFEVGKRHGLALISILDREAKLSLIHNFDFRDNVPASAELAETLKMNGLDRFAARKIIVTRLEEMGLVAKIEPHGHVVPHGDRSNVVIEPFLTDQWYVNAKELAKPAIAAVREGKTQFIPQNWENTYFNWMENIQPWCISRQLWWGHQIPAWYGFNLLPEGNQTTLDLDNLRVFVAQGEDEAIELAKTHYGTNVKIAKSHDQAAIDFANDPSLHYGPWKWLPIWRDEDVLDTWFSSALWPFTTLGWPDETPELKRFYPTSALVTGFDIIFFWVARMMMMGLHFMKDAAGNPQIPFHDVYIHALVRDATGAKMSKSKGNVIDPLALIDEYSADALRFTLAAMAAQGRDIKLSTQRVEGYRNFATKLWNAARFAEMNECATVERFDPHSVRGLINKWIISQLGDTLGNIEKALSDYRFNDAANWAYQFVWNLYCDWYLELAKPIFLEFDEAAKNETRATVAYIRDQILKILHPFMPFITEELWRVTAPNRSEPILALATWPGQQPIFADAHEEVRWLIELVTAIRSVRTEMNVPPSAALQLVLISPSEKTLERARLWDFTLNRLARVLSSVTYPNMPSGAIQLIVGNETFALPLFGIIDFAAERARLAKEMAKADADIKRSEAKLANEKFVANAPEEVVEEEKEKREEAAARRAKLAEALERLKDAG